MIIQNEEQRGLLLNVLETLEHILDYDNKNLYKRQEQDLSYCRDVLVGLTQHKVEFKVGYYEWLIYVDDIAIYHIGDYVSENFENLKELEAYTNELVFSAIEMEANEDINETSFIQDLDNDTQRLWRELSWEQKHKLQQSMVRVLGGHYL